MTTTPTPKAGAVVTTVPCDHCGIPMQDEHCVVVKDPLGHEDMITCLYCWRELEKRWNEEKS